ncbi:MAG: DsbA family protein [Candidatus Puniceispirillales bacterium WSBS_2018_MAG_OTU23]
MNPTPNKTALKNEENKATPKMRGAMIGMLLLSGIIGGVIGGQVTKYSSSIDRQIETHIRENSAAILQTLQNASISLSSNAQQQAIDLVKVNDGNTVFGNPDGDVTIYEFSDYNCGYCKRAFTNLKDVVAADGNIRVVVKELPILAESSYDAAAFSIAAAELGKYAEAHTALMQWQGRLNDRVFAEIADDLGLDATAIAAIVNSDSTKQIIAENKQMAAANNIGGTPAFVIGNIIIPGAIGKDEFIALIAEARERKS